MLNASSGGEMSLVINSCSENCLYDCTEESSKCQCRLIPEDEEMESEEMETIKRLGEKSTPPSDSSPPHKRDRIVSFDANSEYFQNETPLMFSRSSSLSSLGSVEQCSIHDDYSSVVSDFSQRASGIVSPSELPDSPSQVVSQEPRNKVLTNRTPDTSPSNKHISVKVNIFDDTVTPFKEEGTPADYSRATSLSALTFDKEPVIWNELKLPDADVMHAMAMENDDVNVVSDVDIRDGGNSVKDEDMDVSENKSKDYSGCCDVLNLSDEEEDDEDILAACISVGMQGCNKRYSSSVHKDEDSQESGSKNSDLLVKTYKNIGQRLPQLVMASSNLSGVCGDALLSYNTEGTPSNLSHAGSQSDLSMLSFPCDGMETGARGTSEEFVNPSRELQDTEKDFDDCVSNESEDCEDMLAECIRSGMPKPRKSSP